jgi:hypothetical protein
MNVSRQVRSYSVLVHRNLASVSRSSSNIPRVMLANAPSSAPYLDLRLTAQRRWKSDENSDDEKIISDEKSNSNSDSNSPIIYQSPMGGLITRLKIVSITSCLISVVGLPLFIAIKNGDWPTAQQLGLGSVAFLGATGSTVGLHFVFGPYILDMEKIPVRECHFNKEAEEEGEKDAVEEGIEKESIKSNDNKAASPPKDVLLKATTRSVFGLRSEHVFNPATDVTPYEGFRPFANFVAKGVTLYAHPNLLDDDIRQQLLWAKPHKDPENKDDDFL